MPTMWSNTFVQKSIANGIDIIRIFDALNDPRNLEDRHQRDEEGKGRHVQAALSLYHQSRVHHNEYFVELRKTA